MRTLLRPAAVLLVAILLTACGGTGGGGRGPAATVDGTEISRDLLTRIVTSQMSAEGAPTEAEERADATAEVERSVLSTLISIEIVAGLAEEEDVEPTEEELDEAVEEQVELYEAQATEEDEDGFEGFLEQIGLTRDEFRDLIAADSVRREKLAEKYADEVTDEDVQAAYDEQAEPQVDARHILVETEEEALDAIERIEGGEDFADVAEDVSQDGSAAEGGNLGPAPPSRYVPEFAEAVTDAEVGELIGPVETQFGFHVIEVLENLEAAPFEEVEDQIRAQLEQAAGQSPELMALFEEAFGEAEVEVAEEFGTWDPQSGRVVGDDEATDGEPGAPAEGEPEAPAEGELPTDELPEDEPAEQ